MTETMILNNFMNKILHLCHSEEKITKSIMIDTPPVVVLIISCISSGASISTLVALMEFKRQISKQELKEYTQLSILCKNQSVRFKYLEQCFSFLSSLSFFEGKKEYIHVSNLLIQVFLWNGVVELPNSSTSQMQS